LANYDRHWPVWCVSFNPYGDAQPIAPDSLGELRHVPFAAEELPFAIFGLKQESLEIAEAIEDQIGDLSCKGFVLFVRWLSDPISGG
jgi:hypothetical protein